MLPRAVRHIIASPAGERAQVLVLFAGAIVGLMGLVALSVDVGLLVYTRADLQKAADAAALAGAQDLDGTTMGVFNARATADTYLVANGHGTAACRPNCATVNPAGDRITVTLGKDVEFTFARVLGMNSANVNATAQAASTLVTVTGYDWDSVAPFIIWGGSRASEVHVGDGACPLHTCVGKSYTFLDNQWMNASGNPTVPDWTATDSDNFKGDTNHGAGAPVIHVGDSWVSTSDGGLGSVEPPAVGAEIVVPIVSKATGNSNARTFTLSAWALVEVDAGCKKLGCTGTIMSLTTVPPAGYVTGGTVQPPAGLVYQARVVSLVD